MTIEMIQNFTWSSFFLGILFAVMIFIIVIPLIIKKFIPWILKRKAKSMINSFTQDIMHNVQNKSSMFGGILDDILPKVDDENSKDKKDKHNEKREI